MGWRRRKRRAVQTKGAMRGMRFWSGEGAVFPSSSKTAFRPNAVQISARLPNVEPDLACAMEGINTWQSIANIAIHAVAF